MSSETPYRELRPEEVILPSDCYQTKYGGSILFPVLYSATMTVEAALGKFSHITAYYREAAPNCESPRASSK